jgi:hypothetical protein
MQQPAGTAPRSHAQRCCYSRELLCPHASHWLTQHVACAATTHHRVSEATFVRCNGSAPLAMGDRARTTSNPGFEASDKAAESSPTKGKFLLIALLLCFFAAAAAAFLRREFPKELRCVDSLPSQQNQDCTGSAACLAAHTGPSHPHGGRDNCCMTGGATWATDAMSRCSWVPGPPCSDGISPGSQQNQQGVVYIADSGSQQNQQGHGYIAGSGSQQNQLERCKQDERLNAACSCGTDTCQASMYCVLDPHDDQKNQNHNNHNNHNNQNQNQNQNQNYHNDHNNRNAKNPVQCASSNQGVQVPSGFCLCGTDNAGYGKYCHAPNYCISTQGSHMCSLHAACSHDTILSRPCTCGTQRCGVGQSCNVVPGAWGMSVAAHCDEVASCDPSRSAAITADCMCGMEECFHGEFCVHDSTSATAPPRCFASVADAVFTPAPPTPAVGATSSVISRGPFIVPSGSWCQIDAEGCLTDGPGDYGNYEECSIRVSRAVVLTARQYDVEKDYDFLTIGFQDYKTSGDSQIVGVSAPANSIINWRTDGSATAGGFVLCETSPTSSASAADCTCRHGTPTLGSGSGATLCEASGTEDCSACDFGYQLSASPGAQTCVPNSSPYFSVISGGQHCRIDAQGCVTDGPGNYSIAGSCEIRMLDNAELNTTEYEIEDEYDYLTVTRIDSYSCVGTDYAFSAGGGPSGLFSKNTKIEWYSDKDTVAAGFVLCAGVPTSAACSKLGTECQEWPATPYCDIKATPSGTESEGACKGEEDISSDITCTSLLATSTGNVNTFAPVQTTCEYGEKLSGTCKSNVWDPRNQTYQAVDNQVASLCAEFLPGPDGPPIQDKTWPQEQPLCCRPSDANLLRWLQRKFDEFDRQFGQCDNCLYSVKKLVCQLACDSENKRFHHADAMVKSYAGQAYSSEAAVCEDYCEGMYLACKHVKWDDTVKYIYKDDHISFCNQVLHLTVTDEEPLDVNGADPLYNSFRICTTETAADDLHCLGKGVHAQLGLVSFLLCFFITMAAILSEQFEKLPTNTFIPDATVTLAVGVGFGALMKIVVGPWEDKTYKTHHTMGKLHRSAYLSIIRNLCF